LLLVRPWKQQLCGLLIQLEASPILPCWVAVPLLLLLLRRFAALAAHSSFVLGVMNSSGEGWGRELTSRKALNDFLWLILCFANGLSGMA
jgi:hypothetical protein